MTTLVAMPSATNFTKVARWCSLGGTHNLEWWKFSDVVTGLLSELGVDPHAMREDMTFDYGHDAPNSPAMWFDADTYGQSRLLPNFSLRNRLTKEQMSRYPYLRRDANLYSVSIRLPPRHRRSLSRGRNTAQSDKLPGFSQGIRSFDRGCDSAIDKDQHGSWGLEMRALSAAEAIEVGYPGLQLFGQDWEGEDFQYPLPCGRMATPAWPDCWWPN